MFKRKLIQIENWTLGVRMRSMSSNVVTGCGLSNSVYISLALAKETVLGDWLFVIIFPGGQIGVHVSLNVPGVAEQISTRKMALVGQDTYWLM